MHEDNDTLSVPSVDRERDDVPTAHTVDMVLDRQLEILRPHVAAVDDDEILAASGDDDGVADEITHITGVQPAVGREHARSFLVSAKIFSHHTRTAKHDVANLTFRENRALCIADLQLVVGQRRATDHQSAYILAVGRHGAALPPQATQVDAIDLYPAIKRCKTHPEGGFRHSIACYESLLAEAAATEGIGKSRQNPRANLVAADAGDTPA